MPKHKPAGPVTSMTDLTTGKNAVSGRSVTFGDRTYAWTDRDEFAWEPDEDDTAGPGVQPRRR